MADEQKGLFDKFSEIEKSTIDDNTKILIMTDQPKVMKYITVNQLKKYLGLI